MRIFKPELGKYYHVYNSGHSGQPIFLDDSDRARFLFSILYLQSSVSFNHLSRQLPHFEETGLFDVSDEVVNSIVADRYVDPVAFIMMLNKFHLIVLETLEGGIASYMQRVLNSYTKYFNTKYGKRGYLFQGPYRYAEVPEKHLAELSGYLHARARDIPGWKGKEDKYPWSSFQDYRANRWGLLLSHGPISNRFPDPEAYKRFVLGTEPDVRQNTLSAVELFA